MCAAAAISGYCSKDDGVRLWLDNQNIFDDWNIHGVENNHGNILKEAGKNMRSEWSILKEPVVLK